MDVIIKERDPGTGDDSESVGARDGTLWVNRILRKLFVCRASHPSGETWDELPVALLSSKVTQTRVVEDTTARVLTDADHGALVICSEADTDITVSAGLRDDFTCRFVFTGDSGDLTFVPEEVEETPVTTINVVTGFDPDVSAQYGLVELLHLGGDEFLLRGDLDASA